MDDQTSKHLIVDSGAIIGNAKLEKLGEKLWTIPEVISEIKDKNARERLELGVYQLNYREPTPMAYNMIVDFAKLTGDYSALSIVDLRVLALALTFELENNGEKYIKTTPTVTKPEVKLHRKPDKDQHFDKCFNPKSKKINNTKIFDEGKELPNYLCPFCKENRFRSEFSKTQLSKGKNKRKCATCVNAARPKPKPKVDKDNKNNDNSVFKENEEDEKKELPSDKNEENNENSHSNKDDEDDKDDNNNNNDNDKTSVDNDGEVKPRKKRKRKRGKRRGRKKKQNDENNQLENSVSEIQIQQQKEEKEQNNSDVEEKVKESPKQEDNQNENDNEDKQPKQENNKEAEQEEHENNENKQPEQEKNEEEEEEENKQNNEEKKEKSEILPSISSNNNNTNPNKINNKSDLLPSISSSSSRSSSSKPIPDSSFPSLGKKQDDNDNDKDNNNNNSAVKSTQPSKPKAFSWAQVVAKTADAPLKKIPKPEYVIESDPSIVIEEEEKEEDKEEDNKETKHEFTFENDDDGEGEWINVVNLPDLVNDISTDFEEDDDNRVPVSCITTDFAMQNILLQMGLRLVSLDGLRINRIKNWALRCSYCHKSCANREAIFCPNCGYDSLEKLSVYIDKNGDIKYRQSRRVKKRLKGKKYSHPLPKTGRCNQKTHFVLSEDELFKFKGKFHQKRRADVFDPDTNFMLPRKQSNQPNIIIGSRIKDPNRPRKRHGKKKRQSIFK